MTTWGGEAGTSSSGQKTSIGLGLELQGGNVARHTYIWSKYSVNDNITIVYGGAGAGSAGYNWVSSGGEVWVRSDLIPISPGQTLTFTAQITGLYNSQSPSVSASISRPYNAPAAPSGLTATRQTDSKIVLSWSNNATSAAPYSGIQVQRRADAGQWVTIANLGAVTGYTDTGTSAGHRYDYQIQATGPGGSSGWYRINYQSDVSTTPVAPTGVTATKNAAGGIDTSATYSGYGWGITFDVAESTDGGVTWTTRATGLSSPSWTHVSPDQSVTHAYRWRAVASEPGAPSPDPTLYGPWSAASATVQLLTPPNPPSSLSPNGVIFDGSASRTFLWQHNPIDTTSQTAYELRYRVAGGSWTTLTGTTSSSRTFAGDTFANGSSWEWQVRTRGQHADFSDWSPVATFQTAARPTVAISAPDGDIATSLVTVSWAFFSAAGVAQRSWMAELIRAGQVVETLQDVGTASTATFASRLSDGETVQVRVTVTDTNGLTSLPDVTTATTTFPMPLAPSVAVSWDRDQGAVLVSVAHERVPAAVPVVSVDIARSVDDGTTWETVAEGVDPGTTVVDRTAPLGGTLRYRATSWSDLPSSTDGEVAELTPPLDRGFLSGGDDFGTVSVIEVNAGGPPVFDVTEGLLERVVSYYEGRALGVEHSGVSRGRTGTVTWALTRDELATLQTLAHLPGPHLLRTPLGDNLYVSISRVSRSAVSGGQWWQVSLSVTEVEP